MKALLFPLIIMVFLAVLSQSISYASYSTSFSGGSSSQTWGGSGGFNVNGNSSSLSYDGNSYNMGFDLTSGAIALVVACIAIAIVGINVVGSGLSDVSVSIIYKSLAFFGFWALLSALSLPAFTSIPVLGWIMYFLLTVPYSVGVFSQVGGS